MEAVRIDEELPLTLSMRRSWSEGDLAQLCEVGGTAGTVFFFFPPNSLLWGSLLGKKGWP